MDKVKDLLSAVVYTGDESNAGMWIGIMVAVGVILVAMAAASVVISKKKKAEEAGTDQKKKDK